VSNSALADAALQRSLPHYIQAQPFRPSHWRAPGLKVDPGGADSRTVSLSRKQLADSCEALCAAYYLSGGPYNAALFLKWMGVPVSVDSQWRQDGSIYPLLMPQAIISPDVQQSITSLQAIIGFQFREPTLAALCLRHSSMSSAAASAMHVDNEVLEFLGDAVIDALFATFTYTQLHQLASGQLSAVRGALCGNKVFARVMVMNQLHHCLSQNVAGFHEACQEYASFVALQSLISAVPVAGQCGCNWCCCWLQLSAVVRFHSAGHAPCVLADAYTNSLLAAARPALDEPVSAHQRSSKHAGSSRSTFVSPALAGPHPPDLLSDAFEAIIGAVFLDSHGHWPTVWRVLSSLMRLPELIDRSSTYLINELDL